MKKRCAAFVMALLLGLAACRMPASPDRPRQELQVQVRISTGEHMYDLRMDCYGRRVFLGGQVVTRDENAQEDFSGGEGFWRLFPRREVLEEMPGYGWAGVLLST